jgi:hypothetical protein
VPGTDYAHGRRVHRVNTWLLLWLRSYTAFLLRRTNNLALLLHDYVEHYCLVPHPMAVQCMAKLAANGCKTYYLNLNLNLTPADAGWPCQ